MLALHSGYPPEIRILAAAFILAMSAQLSAGVPGDQCMLGHLSPLSSQDENATLAPSHVCDVSARGIGHWLLSSQITPTVAPTKSAA